MNNYRFSPEIKIISVLLIAGILIGACTSARPVTLANGSSDAPLAEAEVIFQTKLPAAFSNGESMALEILDEVTGLALNPTRYPMAMIDSTSYFVRVNLPVGAVVKYRYIRIMDVPTPEYSTNNEPLRYRMFLVYGPAVEQDTIAGWINQPYSGRLGRLQGQVISNDNLPVPGLMISIGGLSSFTSSDGTFLIDKIPEGSQNLIAFSMDGAYKTFQQGAVIAANSVTPAIFQVTPANFVNITFTTTPPLGDYANAPIRIVGSLYQMGNTFADLNGGFSVLAGRAPQLTSISGGKFGLTLQLPAGAYIEYKYSLGDGFWNVEHEAGGAFRVRKILVPDKDTLFDDIIDNWGIGKNAPITFNVQVPEITPADDIVSIQFNPFAWTNPIPMWKAGMNQWSYTLISPLDILGEISYRYCRNDQCDLGDFQLEDVNFGIGPVFSPLPNSQTFNDTVNRWPDLQTYNTPVLADSVIARGGQFITGIALTPNYDMTWLPRFENTLKDIQTDSANMIIFSPTWSATDPYYATIEPVIGNDPLWIEMEGLANLVQNKNFSIVIYPRIRFFQGNITYWQLAPKDQDWWQLWFDQYAHFIMNFADLGKQVNATAIIIGGEDILSIVPGGKLPDGSDSGAPAELSGLWSNLINQIRSRFSGQIIWDLPFPGGYDYIPSFLNEVDQIMLSWSAPLAQTSNASIDEITTSFNQQFQTYAFSIQQTFNKSILIGIKYPSIDGAVTGCIPSSVSNCGSFSNLAMPGHEYSTLSLDLQEQADIYLAALRVVDQLNWVNGFVSLDYFPPLELTDKSNSIHGKPAEKIIQYWYAYLRQ